MISLPHHPHAYRSRHNHRNMVRHILPLCGVPCINMTPAYRVPRPGIHVSTRRDSPHGLYHHITILYGYEPTQGLNSTYEEGLWFPWVPYCTTHHADHSQAIVAYTPQRYRYSKSEHQKKGYPKFRSVDHNFIQSSIRHKLGWNITSSNSNK